MYYFIFPMLFLVYLEFLGRLIVSKLNIQKLEFNFLIGFLFLLSYSFVVGIPAVFLGLSFDYLFISYTCFFILSFVFIIVSYKGIDFSFNFIKWFILICIVVYVANNALNMSLGDTNGFDSQFYLNMIVDNIEIDKLFSVHPYFGLKVGPISMQYQFQSFYHLLSVIAYYCKTILELLNYTSFYLVIIVIFSQIIFYFIFAGTCIECVRALKIKNIFLISLYILLMILMYQFRYYHLEFTFIGNSYRFTLLGLLLLFTREYFNTKNRKYILLILLNILSLNATSSSSSFIILIFLFGFFYVVIDFEDNTFEYLGILSFSSILNIISFFSENIKVSSAILIMVSVILLVLIFFNNRLVLIFRRFHFKNHLSILVFIILAILSYKTSGLILDITLYAKNISETFDMNWNYFLLHNKQHVIYNFYIYILVIVFVFRKNDYIKTLLVCISLVFFNPFILPLLNKYNVVWARSFEILFNPLTILILMDVLNFKNKKINNMIYILLIVLFFKYEVITKKATYYHSSFIPDKKYNKIFKYNQDYVDIFYEIDYLIKIDKIKNPKIITENGLIRSFFKDSQTLYGRENKFNGVQKDLELYKIFYPSIYFGDFDAPKNPDLKNMCKYLKDSDYHFIIQNKDVLYYNSDTTFWYGLYYRIEECGYYPVIDTERYKLYKIY